MCGCTYDEDPPQPGDWDLDDLSEQNLAPADLSLDGHRAVWNVGGRAVVVDERGIAPLDDR